MWDIVKSILTDNNFIGAILTSIVFILIGFFLTKKNHITSDGKKAIMEIVLKISLPAMAFSAFMTDFNIETFKENILVFVISFILYIVIIAIGHLIFFKDEKNNRNVMAIFIAVSQLTFFSIPILKAVYSDNYSEVMLPANMMTFSFRIVLYVYCYLIISKLNFSKENIKSSIKKVVLNPIMIAMILGIFVWVSQIFMPTINIDSVSYSIFRIDKIFPSVFTVINVAEKLTTPLAMIIIGCILGGANFSDAFKDKKAWLCSILKTIIVPLFVLIIVTLLQSINIIKFNEFDLAVLVIGFGAPLSAVVSTYCSTFNNNSNLASRVCLLSTILCVVTFPILFILIKVVSMMPFFQ